MKITYIFWLLLSASLAIQLINTTAVFSTDYMVTPEGSTYDLTDVNSSFDTSTPQDDVSLSVTGYATGLGLMKDFFYNMFIVYGNMVNIWGVPPAVAAFLQAIIAVSWAFFFMQILMRFPWGGVES